MFGPASRNLNSLKRPKEANEKREDVWALERRIIERKKRGGGGRACALSLEQRGSLKQVAMEHGLMVVVEVVALDTLAVV